MDERCVILAQIEALAENLGIAERALDAHPIDPDLREAVRIRFSTLINKQQKDMGKLREEVEGGLPLDACWCTFRDIRRECMPIFRECLAFLEGALVRSAGLDDGICHVADALLDDLSHRTDIHWARLTILAEGEFFDQMAEIIRLRFPEFSIWNLPIAGHEFGHLVGQELRELKPDGYRYPFEEILQREGQTNRQNVHFLREHFADLLAIYAMGPAFACTCILLRFDPGEAYKDGREHPSYAKRVYFILKALERMDEAEGMWQSYRGIIEYLRGLWQESLVAVRQPESLDQDTIVQLNDWLEELYDVLLDTYLSPHVRYSGWHRAQRLSIELMSDRGAARMLEGDDTLPDVLNAAWLCRIQHWDEDGYIVRRIGDKAVDLCREIIRRRS